MKSPIFVFLSIWVVVLFLVYFFVFVANYLIGKLISIFRGFFAA